MMTELFVVPRTLPEDLAIQTLTRIIESMKLLKNVRNNDEKKETTSLSFEIFYQILSIRVLTCVSIAVNCGKCYLSPLKFAVT